MSVQDTLTKQILGQGLTSKWTGEGLGSAEANAADMARMLAEAGITDIKQFGIIPIYDRLETQYIYDGKPATPVGNGMVEAMVLGPYGYSYETIPMERATKVYATPEDISNGSSIVDTSKVKFVNGNPVLDRGQTGYGNKVTGQTITSTYNKQGGNVFGGTREGAGTTGYQVEFTPDGTPVFYTSYSSNNNAKDFLPLLAIAGLAFGAPLLGEAFGGGLSALDAGMGVYGSGAGASLLGAAEGLSALDAGMGVYGGTGNIGLSALDAGMGVYGNTELGNALAKEVASGAITAEQATSAANAAAKAAASGGAFPLSVSDALRLAGIAATVAGGAKAISGAGGSSGTGGFDIVPVPSDWKSPPPTSVAEFTPLAPIDFGNKQMLQGTQWGKLLSPTYNQAAPMPNPAVSTNPSNMSFDQLMGVLGNTQASIPTQNVSINDVIAGIQSQYGQAPQGSMG